MKFQKQQLFPTDLYLFDNVLEVEYIDSMKLDILESAKNNPRGNWQSKPDLRKHLKYKSLVDKILQVSKIIFEDKKYIYDRFEITDMWSNILLPGETHRTHTHSNNILSGVYYIESDNKASIQFYDPRPAAGVINPKIKEYNWGNATAWQIDSITNRMVLFPSWLQHYVPVNTSDNARISIAFNIMLRGIVGNPEDYQSAEI